MTLQERIDFILNKNFPASVKRKHLIYLIQHLNYYSEDTDELGIAYIVISEAIEKLDNESSSLNQAHEFKSRKYDNERVEQNEFKQFENWLKGNQTPIAPKPLTVTELDRTLEFFLTYNILTMQQVQEIRAKASSYLR